MAFLDRLGVGALLADDMGLGKTVQLLALEALRREAGPRPPTLIVCPLSILGNWQREIRRFTPDLTRRGRTTAATRESGATDLVLTTYQVAARDVEALGRDRVGPDRAGRGPAGQERRHRYRPGPAPAARARHRVALTGTPVENRLADLWSIMDFLNPDLLGPAEHLPGPLLGAGGTLRRRGRRGPAAPGHPAAGTAPAQDRRGGHRRPAREARAHPVVQPHRRAGLAVPGGRGRAVRQAARAAARQPPQGTGAVGDDQAQAGLQPPGPSAGRRFAAAGPVGEGASGWRRSWPPRSPRATRRWCSPSSPGSARCCGRTCATGSAPRSRSCTAVPPRGRVTRWSSASRTGPGRGCCCCRSRPAVPA